MGSNARQPRVAEGLSEVEVPDILPARAGDGVARGEGARDVYGLAEVVVAVEGELRKHFAVAVLQLGVCGRDLKGNEALDIAGTLSEDWYWIQAHPLMWNVQI